MANIKDREFARHSRIMSVGVYRPKRVVLIVRSLRLSIQAMNGLRNEVESTLGELQVMMRASLACRSQRQRVRSNEPGSLQNS